MSLSLNIEPVELVPIMGKWEVVADEGVASRVIGGVGPVEPNGVVAGCCS